MAKRKTQSGPLKLADGKETPPAVDIILTVVEFFDEGELAMVENQDGDEFELKTSDFTHDAEEINEGDTLLLHINREAAIAAGLVDPALLAKGDATAEVTSEDTGAEAKLPVPLCGRDVRWLKNDTCRRSVPLSDDDKLKLGEEMAAAQERIDDLEDELADIRKDFKTRIEAEQVRLSKAAKEFREGKTEPQDVECDVFQDFTAGEIVYVTADEAAEIVFRRPMTAEERQPSLFDAPPRGGKADAPATGTTEPTPQTWGHTCVNCGHLADSPEGQQAEECAACTQSGSGSVDNWTPRRECATCNYKNTQVGLPPCSSCTRNPQTDATTAEDDNWIIAAQPESTDEAPADAESCGETVAMDDAEPQAGTALQ